MYVCVYYIFICDYIMKSHGLYLYVSETLTMFFVWSAQKRDNTLWTVVAGIGPPLGSAPNKACCH